MIYLVMIEHADEDKRAEIDAELFAPRGNTDTGRAARVAFARRFGG